MLKRIETEEAELTMERSDSAPDGGVTQQRVHDEIKAEREALVAYLEALPEGAWDKETLSAPWTVRDLVCHLVGNAKDITERNLDGAGSPEFNQRQIDERAGKTPRELLDEFAQWGPAFEQGILDLDDDFWNAPYPPFGNVSDALQRMVEDIVVHHQDIRVPLGDPAVAGPGLGSALEVIAHELQTRAPEFAPTVGSVTFDAGDFQHRVEIGDGEAVEIKGDPMDVALVGTGRLGVDKISITPLPDGFATALNIYAS